MSADRLPPLAAIRVFEAVARQLSFTRAAAELGMTQAAASYQIKVLEERVGAPLFLRRPRGIALSETGRRLAPAATEALELLSAAWADARHGAQGTLVISTWQTFAANWLARNLGDFQVKHPGIAVRLETTSRLTDFASDEVDVGIRSGLGDWPGLAAHHLMEADFTPMLSRRLAESIGGVVEPADLTGLPILDPADPWWPQWFEAAGLEFGWLNERTPTDFGSQALVASAAIAGHGVAILTPAFYQSEVDAGLLLQPFPLRCSAGQSIWLVYPRTRRNAPKVRAFRDWLLRRFSDAPQDATEA